MNKLIRGGGGSLVWSHRLYSKKGGCGVETTRLLLCILHSGCNYWLSNALGRIVITRTRYISVRVSLLQEIVKSINRLMPGQKISWITKKSAPKTIMELSSGLHEEVRTGAARQSWIRSIIFAYLPNVLTGRPKQDVIIPQPEREGTSKSEICYNWE